MSRYVLALACSEFLLGAGYVISVSNNLAYIYNATAPNTTHPIACVFQSLPLLSGWILEMAFLLVIAVDRCFALFRPIWYYFHAGGLQRGLLGTAVLTGVLFGAFGFIFMKQTGRPMVKCSMEEAVSKDYTGVFWDILTGCSGAASLAYVSTGRIDFTHTALHT